MRSKKDQHAIWLISGVVIAVISLLGTVAYVNGRPKPGPDNCVGNPDASTVILLDRSETVTRQTLDEIRARAMRYVLDSVQDNERVAVFAVDDSSGFSLTPLVSLCRPRKDGNRLTENVQVLAKQFSERFERPIDSALSQVTPTGKASPIAQAITDLSLSQYLKSQRNTLLVFSDMLENTASFSLYRCRSDGDVIRAFRDSRKGAMERPTFKNAKIRLNIIPRLDQSRATLGCRDRLWLWFFGDNPGANAALEFEYLPGGPSMPAHTQRVN